MGAYKKLILDEKANTVIGKDFEEPYQNVVSSQVKKFDKYNSDKVRDLFAEYDQVTVNDTDLKNLTLVKANAIEKEKLSFRSKLFITSASLIVALMLFMVIYNIFVINSLGNGIQILQNNVMAEQNSYNQIVEMTEQNESKIREKLEAQGFSPITDDAIITIELGETSQVYELKGETNWFDAFCNFISRLFDKVITNKDFIDFKDKLQSELENI